MEIFKNKNNGRKVVISDNFERMLKKNVNGNMHSYIRYRIAMLFGKKTYAKLFEHMHQRVYMTQELINRRIELCNAMMTEIRTEYGYNAVKYLNQFL